MKKEDMDGNLVFETPYFNSEILEVKNKYEIQIALDRGDEKIKERAAKWISKGSGWTVEKVEQHCIGVYQYSIGYRFQTTLFHLIAEV